MAPRGGTEWAHLLRGGTAVAALLAGSVVLAVATAGVLVDVLAGAGVAAGPTIAFGLAALLPAMIVVAATATVTERRQSRRLGGIGGAITTASVLLWAITGPSGPTASPAATVASLGYALGLAVPLVTLVKTVSDTGTNTAAGSASWVASDRQRSQRRGTVPADGGSTDSELSFPLDADDEEDREDR